MDKLDYDHTRHPAIREPEMTEIVRISIAIRVVGPLDGIERQLDALADQHPQPAAPSEVW